MLAAKNQTMPRPNPPALPNKLFGADTRYVSAGAQEPVDIELQSLSTKSFNFENDGVELRSLSAEPFGFENGEAELPPGSREPTGGRFCELPRLIMPDGACVNPRVIHSAGASVATLECAYRARPVADGSRRHVGFRLSYPVVHPIHELSTDKIVTRLILLMQAPTPDETVTLSTHQNNAAVALAHAMEAHTAVVWGPNELRVVANAFAKELVKNKLVGELCEAAFRDPFRFLKIAGKSFEIMFCRTQYGFPRSEQEARAYPSILVSVGRLPSPREMLHARKALLEEESTPAQAR